MNMGYATCADREGGVGRLDLLNLIKPRSVIIIIDKKNKRGRSV